MKNEKDIPQIKCMNLNHRCTGFDKGNCKMVNAVCAFQLVIEKSNVNQNEKQKSNLRD